MVAIVLMLSGTYGDLLDYVVFADWIFFGLTAASIFVLRARDTRKGVAFAATSVPWHPYTTLVFIGAAGYVTIGSVTTNPGNALRGAALLALGIPVYLYWRRNGARLPTDSPAT